MQHGLFELKESMDNVSRNLHFGCRNHKWGVILWQFCSNSISKRKIAIHNWRVFSRSLCSISSQEYVLRTSQRDKELFVKRHPDKGATHKSFIFSKSNKPHNSAHGDEGRILSWFIAAIGPTVRTLMSVAFCYVKLLDNVFMLGDRSNERGGTTFFPEIIASWLNCTVIYFNFWVPEIAARFIWSTRPLPARKKKWHTNQSDTLHASTPRAPLNPLIKTFLAVTLVAQRGGRPDDQPETGSGRPSAVICIAPSVRSSVGQAGTRLERAHACPAGGILPKRGVGSQREKNLIWTGFDWWAYRLSPVSDPTELSKLAVIFRFLFHCVWVMCKICVGRARSRWWKLCSEIPRYPRSTLARIQVLFRWRCRLTPFC